MGILSTALKTIVSAASKAAASKAASGSSTRTNDGSVSVSVSNTNNPMRRQSDTKSAGSSQAINDRVGGVTRDTGTGKVYAQTGSDITGVGLHDYVNDKTDYSALALGAKSVSELQTRLAERAMKAEAQGIDISGSTPGILSNDQIAQQWRQQTGQYLPSSFRGSDGVTTLGYYGQDENGRFGYYADPQRTVKLANGRWDTQRSGATAETTARLRSGGSASGGGYGGSGGYGGGSGGYEYHNNGSAYGSDIPSQLMQLYNGQNSMYAQALAEQKAAQEAAVKRAVNELEGQRSTVDQQYSDLYRQAYVDRMNAQKNLEQRLAAQGITGGASESTMLGLSTAYSDALRRAEQQRINEQAGIDRAIADTRYSGDISIAEAAAEALRNQTDRHASVLKDLLSYYDTLAARQQAYDREDAQRANAYAREDAQRANAYAREDAQRANAYAREDAQTSAAYARQLVQQILAAGNMPDDETLSAAGMTRAQAIALLPQTTEAAYTPTFSQSQVYDAAKRGLLTGNMLRDYNWYVYGDPDYGR